MVTHITGLQGNDRMDLYVCVCVCVFIVVFFFQVVFYVITVYRVGSPQTKDEIAGTEQETFVLKVITGDRELTNVE